MSTCRYCGMFDLRWMTTKTGFRLYDAKLGKVHNCKPTLKRLEQVRNGVGRGCEHGIAKDWFCADCEAQGRYK